MIPVRRILLAAAPLLACGDAPEPLDPTMQVPDFALVDVNPSSASHDQEVSPRDYLDRVSGWYYAHAT